MASRPDEVEVVEVSARQVVETYVATGRVRSRKASLVGSELPGLVEVVHVEPGDRPRAGDVLVELRPIDARFAVDQAKARVTIIQEEYERIKRGPTPAQLRSSRTNVKSAQVNLAEAKRALERQRQLLSSGVATSAEVDRAETDFRRAQTQLTLARSQLAELNEQPRLGDVRVAQARIEEAESNLKQIEANLGKTVITAPFHGLVLSADVSVGEQVATGQGLIRLAETENLEVYAEVDEAYFGRLKPDMSAIYVFPSILDQRFEGKVRQVGPEVDGARGVVGVHLAASGFPDLVVPGLTVDVAIELRKIDDARAVPRQSVTFVEARPYVFEIEGGVAKQRAVEIEAEGEDYFALEGLEVGTILVKDATAVEDGQSVVSRRETSVGKEGR